MLWRLCLFAISTLETFHSHQRTRDSRYPASSSSISDAVQISSRADKNQLAESLPSVSQLLSANRNLLAEHTQMIAE